MNRIMTVKPSTNAMSQNDAFVLVLSTLPGILLYLLIAHHTPWFLLVPYVAFFAYMGIPAMISIAKKRAA